MSVINLLNKEHSKEITMQVVKYVKDDDERLNELMNIFLHGEWRLVQRAAWPVGIIGEKTDKLGAYIPAMIENLQKHKLHDAVKRNTVRSWQFMNIPEEHLGEVAEVCFNYLGSQKEPIAVKVFSMVVLEKIVKRVPELKDELKFLIEEQLPYGSAGFKNRGKKVLAELAKL